MRVGEGQPPHMERFPGRPWVSTARYRRSLAGEGLPQRSGGSQHPSPRRTGGCRGTERGAIHAGRLPPWGRAPHRAGISLRLAKLRPERSALERRVPTSLRLCLPPATLPHPEQHRAAPGPGGPQPSHGQRYRRFNSFRRSPPARLGPPPEPASGARMGRHPDGDGAAGVHLLLEAASVRRGSGPRGQSPYGAAPCPPPPLPARLPAAPQPPRPRCPCAPAPQRPGTGRRRVPGEPYLRVVEAQVQEIGVEQGLVADLIHGQLHGGQHPPADPALLVLLGLAERHQAHDGDRRGGVGGQPGSPPGAAPRPAPARRHPAQAQEQQQHGRAGGGGGRAPRRGMHAAGWGEEEKEENWGGGADGAAGGSRAPLSPGASPGGGRESNASRFQGSLGVSSLSPTPPPRPPPLSLFSPGNNPSGNGAYSFPGLPAAATRSDK